MLTNSHSKNCDSKFIFIFSTLMLISSICHCAIKPSKEKGEFHQTDLVELIKLDTTFKLDIRYATCNNFTGKALYSEARAFLQRDAALALVRANAKMKKYGYGIIVYDGYRPWSITKKFWQITPKSKKMYVANPKQGSRHNRGCAVDVSLYSLSTGEPIAMVSDFDDMSQRANICYQGGSYEQQVLKYLLIRIMNEEGFMAFSKEWWHFDYKGWKRYQILDIPFSEL